MFVNQSYKCFTYFCQYRFTERRVKPDYIPFLLSTLCVIGACFLKCYFMVINTDLSRVSEYMAADSLNTFSFKDNLESLVSVESGEWFDSL